MILGIIWRGTLPWEVLENLSKGIGAHVRLWLHGNLKELFLMKKSMIQAFV